MLAPPPTRTHTLPEPFPISNSCFKRAKAHARISDSLALRAELIFQRRPSSNLETPAPAGCSARFCSRQPVTRRRREKKKTRIFTSDLADGAGAPTIIGLIFARRGERLRSRRRADLRDCRRIKCKRGRLSSRCHRQTRSSAIIPGCWNSSSWKTAVVRQSLH